MHRDEDYPYQSDLSDLWNHPSNMIMSHSILDYKFRHLIQECEDAAGKCVPAGTKSFPCKIRNQVYDDCSCEVTTEGHVEYFVKETEDVKLQKQPGGGVKGVNFCKIAGTGKEYKPGDTWTDKCMSFKCTGKKKKPFKITNRECQDSKGGCRKPGKDKFDCQIDGKTHKDCLCTQHKDDSVTYDYTDENGIEQSHQYYGGIEFGAVCTDQGKTYSRGQKWLSDCSVVTCLADTGQNVIVVERRCKSTDGKCVAVGTLDFACTMNNKPRKSCRCEGGPDNTVIYKVNEEKKNKGECEDPKSNVRYGAGKTWKRDCVTFKCAADARVTVEKRECMSFNGTCLAIGSSGFKCTLISKQVVDKCTCRLVDDQIIYTGPETTVRDLQKPRQRKKRWLDSIWPW